MRSLILGAAVALASAPALAQTVAVADMENSAGEMIGDVTLQETPAGGVLVRVDIENLPPGSLAFHIHETGRCVAPEFTSAGGHYAGDKAHGFMDPDGPHPGDFPNVRVGDDGSLRQTFYNDRIGVSDGQHPVLDEDGSAVVIHAGPDDYRSQPAGDAGTRIACGVIEAPP
ncbi:MAG: superoxide dismutase family protein [Alphaproteobacteria bacterium]